MSDDRPRFRDSPFYQPIILGLLTLAATAALANTDLLTKSEIAARRAEDLNASLSQVLPDALRDNDVVKDAVTIEGTTVYRAFRGDAATAVAFSRVGQGYGGAITILLGVSADGGLLGVRVLTHTETPGLGDKIEVRKSNWIKAFDGLSLDNTPPEKWAVKKDGGMFDQFSGATITPRAVVATVKDGLTFFAAHRETLLAPRTEPIR